MLKCLSAYTSTDGRSYPPFINASVEDDTGLVVVSLRGEPSTTREGAQAFMKMTQTQWLDFLLENIKKLVGE